MIGAAVIAFGTAAVVERLLDMTRRPPAPSVVTGAVPGATRLPRAVWPMGAHVVCGTASAAMLLAFAESAASKGSPIWVTAFLLGAAALLSLPVFVALGLVRAGGLVLTADGIEVRSRGMVARVPWPLVGEVGSALDGRVRVNVLPGNAERTFAAPWWRGGKYPEHAIDLDTTDLDMTAWGLTQVLNYYRDHPDQCGELGVLGAVARRALESARALS